VLARALTQTLAVGHADDYPDEEVFFHDLADGRMQVQLPFIASANRTLTLPPVTWVDRPPRDAEIELHIG
jgi:hypothetical protein